jgi:hypothetical protein
VRLFFWAISNDRHKMNLPKAIVCCVSKRILLFEAAVVWTFAGSILLFKGSKLLAASSGFSWLNIMICSVSGLIFFILMFSKISRNHIIRITNLYGDHHGFYEFFSRRSYIMMLSMISLGIFLRKTSFIPLAYLSLAYITMGIPLLLSSFRFYHRWIYYLPLIDSTII